MSKKEKIDRYIKSVSNNETYQKYLKEAVEFGYGLAKAENKELKAKLAAFNDLGMNSVIITEQFDDY